jgi:hypothetical protein
LEEAFQKHEIWLHQSGIEIPKIHSVVGGFEMLTPRADRFYETITWVKPQLRCQKAMLSRGVEACLF